VEKCHRRRRKKIKWKECVKCKMNVSVTLLEDTDRWMGLEEGGYG
jgi:hypothetical protein